MAILKTVSGINDIIPQGSDVTTTTSATYHDSDLSDYALDVNGSSPNSQFYVDINSAQTEMWLHFTLYDDSDYSGSHIDFIDSASGNVQFDLYVHGSQLFDIRKYDSGTVTLISDMSYPVDSKNEWDIYLKIHATTGEVKVYKNKVLVGSFNGDTSTDNNQIDRLLFKSTSPDWNQAYYSQIIIADENTIGFKLASLTPNADDSTVNWTGDYTDIDEFTLGGTDFITSDTLNAVALFNKANLNTLYNGWEVKGLTISTRYDISAGSTVNDLQHAVKTGGNTYTGASLGTVKDGTVHVKQTLFATNPDTSNPWTTTEINGSSIGCKVVS
jgi:hypothetical protein